jgi:hypothetical protein
MIFLVKIFNPEGHYDLPEITDTGETGGTR